MRRINLLISFVLFCMACSEIVEFEDSSGYDNSILERKPENMSLESERVSGLAKFVFEDLKRLSRTRIYDTVKMGKVLSASQKDGVFNMNFYLSFEITSPYLSKTFNANKIVNNSDPTEYMTVIDCVVMQSHADGIMSVAVKDFPEFDEDVLEEYRIKQIKQNKLKREAQLKALRLQPKTSPMSYLDPPQYYSEDDIANYKRIYAGYKLIGDADLTALLSKWKYLSFEQIDLLHDVIKMKGLGSRFPPMEVARDDWKWTDAEFELWDQVKPLVVGDDMTREQLRAERLFVLKDLEEYEEKRRNEKKQNIADRKIKREKKERGEDEDEDGEVHVVDEQSPGSKGDKKEL